LTFSKASTTVLDVQLQNTGRSLTVSFGTALDALQAISESIFFRLNIMRIVFKDA